MPEFDVIVLGGGSAGTSAAREAAAAGARTALVNDGELGGLCILRGCMPTKAMLESAHALHHARHLGRFGIRAGDSPRADFGEIYARKNAQVRRFQRAKIRSIEQQPYEVIAGRGRFAGDGALQVEGRRLRAKRYVVATGSRPSCVPIPGCEDVPRLTSDDVMRLDAQPSALIVQGGGFVGLELAQFFARIGTRVLLVNRSPLLRAHDPDAGKELARALRDEENLDLVVPGAIEAVRRDGAGLVARVRSDGAVREHRADALLQATGREPAVDDLGLDAIGISCESGVVEHDDRMRTANHSVYVAGDATGRDKILHVANQEGGVAGFNAAGGTPPRTIDRRLSMTAVFTDPPFAQVGMTEAEAAARGIDVVKATSFFPETGRAITMGVDYGMWTMLADRRSGEILGASILGPRADDLIHIVSVMLHHRDTVDVISQLPWYHPTLAEVIMNLGRDLTAAVHGSPIGAPEGA